MNRARWYSSSTVLLNGEVYTQGGSGGTDFPEIRATTGAFRLLTGAGTSSFDFMYPRNFIAPDGRVFGYDSLGKMYYVNTAGNGAVSNAGQFSGPTGSDASAAMFRPGRILQFGGNSNGAVVIDITQRRTGGDDDRVDVDPAPAGQRDGSCGRQGAGHRRQLGLERTHQRQQQRRDLGPEDRHLDRRRQRQPRAPVPLGRRADAGRQRAGGGRRRAGPAEQHQLRGLLSAVPVRRLRGFRAAPRHSIGAVGARHRPDVRRRLRVVAEHRPRGHGQDDGGDAQLQHGAALRRTDVHGQRQPPDGAVADPRRRCPAGLLPAVRARQRGRAVGRAHRQGQRRDGAEPGGDSGPRRSRQPGRPGRYARVAAACGDRSERRRPRLRRQRLAPGSVDQRHHGPYHRHRDCLWQSSTSWWRRATASTATSGTSSGP